MSGDPRSSAESVTGDRVPTAVRGFVHALRSRTAHIQQQTALPDEPTSALREVNPDAILAARFASEVAAVGCDVRRVTMENWLLSIEEILRGHAARSVLIEPGPETALTPKRAASLRQALAAKGLATMEDPSDDDMFAVDVSVTGVVTAVAETATMVCVSGSRTARGATLIPPAHIALVARSQIVPDLFDTFEQISAWGQMPANVNLITGPSKTADIEGVLVTGIHGPGSVHVLLLDE